MNAVTQLFEQLEGFAESIAAAIEIKDWDDLNELLINRHKALEQLCELPLSASEREAATKIMTAMQATDNQVLPLVQSQKEVLKKQAAALAHDRKAIQAYQSE